MMAATFMQSWKILRHFSIRLLWMTKREIKSRWKFGFIFKIVLITFALSFFIFYILNFTKQLSYVCSFVKVDYFDQQLDSLFKFQPYPNCKKWIPLIYINSMGKLQKNLTEIKRLGLTVNLNCTFKSVIPTGPKNYILKGEYSIQQDVHSDIVHVICRNESKEIIYSDILYHVKKREHVFNSLQNETQKHPSVMLFGIDSLSSLVAERALPKTLKYIREVLGGYELFHYNKVGLNTKPNLLAALTGMTFLEALVPTFAYPKLFQNLLDKGYITCKGEDNLMPIGPMGFKYPMYHHDVRKYFEAANDIKIYLKLKDVVIKASDYFVCKGNEAKHKILLNFNKDCFTKYANKRKLVFSWIVDISHDELFHLEDADTDFLEYLKWMKNSGILNNTVLVVFGDHGPVILGKTDLGRYTNRMPYFNIVIPPNMAIVKTALENLSINKHRLTTHFDFHETLKDIISSKHRITKKHGTSLERGISLFSEIPKRRSCEDAHIPENYCPCYLPKAIHDMEKKKAASIGQFLIDELNSILIKANLTQLCLPWHKPQIISIYKLYIPATNIERFMVTIQVLPKMAEFMATVDINKHVVSLLNTIDRTSKYGNQPACLENIWLFETYKQYCVCED